MFSIPTNVGGASPSFLGDSQSSTLSIPQANSLYINASGDEFFGQLDMNLNRIKELGKPKDSADATTKDYVDESIIDYFSQVKESFQKLKQVLTIKDKELKEQIQSVSKELEKKEQVLTIKDKELKEQIQTVSKELEKKEQEFNQQLKTFTESIKKKNTDFINQLLILTRKTDDEIKVIKSNLKNYVEEEEIEKIRKEFKKN